MILQILPVLRPGVTMLERSDIEAYTAKKQELQVIVETLFSEMMGELNITEFLKNPRAYTRAFMATGAADVIKAVASDAYKVGQSLASKGYA